MQAYQPAISALQALTQRPAPKELALLAQQTLQGLEKMAQSSSQSMAEPKDDEKDDEKQNVAPAQPLQPVSVNAPSAPSLQAIKNQHTANRATRFGKQILKHLAGSAQQKSALLNKLQTALTGNARLYGLLSAKRLSLKGKDIQAFAKVVADELTIEVIDDLLAPDGMQTLADAVDVGVETLPPLVAPPAKEHSNNPVQKPVRQSEKNDDQEEGYIAITNQPSSNPPQPKPASSTSGYF